jgi:hypothetical protein
MTRQLFVKPRKQYPHQFQLFELLTKQPHNLGIRYEVFELQPQKAHERESVAYLAFDPVIRQIVQLLQYRHFEHQHHIDWLGSCVALALSLMNSIQIRAEGFPVNFGIQNPTRWSPISVSLPFRSAMPKNPGWVDFFIA